MKLAGWRRHAPFGAFAIACYKLCVALLARADEVVE
jgi:hypothetical protein